MRANSSWAAGLGPTGVFCLLTVRPERKHHSAAIKGFRLCPESAEGAGLGFPVGDNDTGAREEPLDLTVHSCDRGFWLLPKLHNGDMISLYGILKIQNKYVRILNGKNPRSEYRHKNVSTWIFHFTLIQRSVQVGWK